MDEKVAAITNCDIITIWWQQYLKTLSKTFTWKAGYNYKASSHVKTALHIKEFINRFSSIKHPAAVLQSLSISKSPTAKT